MHQVELKIEQEKQDYDNFLLLASYQICFFILYLIHNQLASCIVYMKEYFKVGKLYLCILKDIQNFENSTGIVEYLRSGT